MCKTNDNFFIDICQKQVYAVRVLQIRHRQGRNPEGGNRMGRPQKKRFICRLPRQKSFVPEEGAEEEIILSVDEYEAIRLIDLEGNTQEECSRQMQVARTTVQSIYDTARRKLAEAIVDGKRLVIEGGDYRLCEFYETNCGRGCGRHCRRFTPLSQGQKTGGNDMKIAVTYENGQIFQHFGHTEQFKLYTVEDGKIVSAEVVDTMGSGHGALAGFLVDHKVDTLVCGGIGGGAQTALASAGIRLFGGVSGPADEAVEALLENRLQYNPSVRCSHHDHEHGKGEHTCGEHGCGKHSC